jgi:hypothetical protein
MSRNRRKTLALAGFMLLAGGLGLLPSAAHANRGQCSQPFTAGADPSASDCLFILGSAVGNQTCDNPCICSPKGTLPPRATDALICLNASVGAPVTLACPCADLKDAAFAFGPGDVTNANIAAQFDAVDYKGAFEPGVDSLTGDWTRNWTVDLHGNFFVWEPATGGTLNGAVPTATGTCPTGTTDVGDETIPAGAGGGSMDVCQLAARYDTDGQTVTLTNDNIYTLGGAGNQGTFIGDGDADNQDASTVANVNLAIEPGTLILGVPSEALKITRGSTINALGTAVDPIVMTAQSQFDDWQAGGDGDTANGEWGGLIVTGFGEANNCNDLTFCDALVEGVITPFAWGGFDNADDSGTITYVVVDKGGFGLAPNTEINSITLFGIGRNSDISFIQANDNTDDGIELFGGEVVIKNAVSTNNWDDSFDTDVGYTGGIQFGLGKQTTVEGDKGFEIDNLVIADTPISEPTFANITMINSIATTGNTVGIGPRSGTGAYFWNGLIVGSERAAIRSENNTVVLNGGVLSDPDDGILQIHNYSIFADPVPTDTYFAATGGGTAADVQTWYEANPNNDTGVDPTISSTGFPGTVDNNP